MLTGDDCTLHFAVSAMLSCTLPAQYASVPFVHSVSSACLSCLCALCQLSTPRYSYIASVKMCESLLPRTINRMEHVSSHACSTTEVWTAFITCNSTQQAHPLSCREPHQPRTVIELEHVWSHVGSNVEFGTGSSVGTSTIEADTANMPTPGFSDLKRMVLEHLGECIDPGILSEDQSIGGFESQVCLYLLTISQLGGSASSLAHCHGTVIPRLFLDKRLFAKAVAALLFDSEGLMQQDDDNQT